MAQSIIRQTTEYIFVHHSVTQQGIGQEATLQNILHGHMQRGLAYDGNPAYHVVIGNDWQALVRPENSVGYHAHNLFMNYRSVAVCLVGNFNENTPTAYQEQKLRDQINNWVDKYGIGKDKILLHRQVHNTACPGSKITKPYIESLLGTEQMNVKAMFLQIWHVPAARGDELYFIKRYEHGTITNKTDMENKMKFWYNVVYPNGQFSAVGNERWQNEKTKVLNGG